MFDFKRLSIRNKLMAIMLLTTGSVLALATLVMVVNEALTLERSTRQQLAALADVIAASARGPMSLSDPVTAYDMLEALRSKGNIVYAQLRNPDGSVFAEFRRHGAADAAGEHRRGAHAGAAGPGSGRRDRRPRRAAGPHANRSRARTCRTSPSSRGRAAWGSRRRTPTGVGAAR